MTRGRRFGADPTRVLAELDALRDLTATEAGAQRVAWTPTWARARAWLRAQLDELPVEVEVDEAGNLWATLAPAGGEDGGRAIVIGSHLDSVPDGGWLDGCLGVIAALEVLRALAAGPPAPLAVRLVDWADEEGARFGRSLFGSSAVAGLLDLDEVRGLTDAAGRALPDALAEHGVALDDVPRAAGRLRDAAGYIELHIEQGPALEEAGLAIGVVNAVFGVRRHRIRFEGRASHAGSTPMHLRRDPVASAARLVLAARDGAVRHGGVATVGVITPSRGSRPRSPARRRSCWTSATATPGRCRACSTTPAPTRRRSPPRRERRWAGRRCRRGAGRIRRAARRARRAVGPEVAGECAVLPSGALHDAAMVARAGVPAVMLFVQSIGGISHNRIEDSHREHVALGVRALDLLARRLAME